MTIKNPDFANRDWRKTRGAYSPESVPDTRLPGNPLVALRGLWPGDINDGFEEAIREMRDSELELETPAWCQEWRE